MEPNKYYTMTIESRFRFGDNIFPIKCQAIKDAGNDRYYPHWFVGDMFEMVSICTNAHHDKVYLGEHLWGKENQHLALDVDAYHTLEDAAHEVELRNKHYIKE